MTFARSARAKYWVYEKNGGMRPEDVQAGSHVKYWFRCEICNHDFDMALGNITFNKQWCPYCSKRSRRLCKDEDCDFCYQRSFASHELASSWSDKNKQDPRDVMKRSRFEFWFVCHDRMCGHEYYTSPTHGYVNCPYCSSSPKYLCEDEDCDSCFKKSFASHYRSKYWSKKNSVKPRDVFKCSGLKYWFYCNVCKHKFIKKIITVTNQGTWCPYCAYPPNKLCNNDKCNLCFNNSFASNYKSKFWSDVNTTTPRNCFKASTFKFWFKCEKGHQFYSALSKINDGSWCPKCHRKGETKLFEALSNHYEIETNCKFKWCKNESKTYYLPFDGRILGDFKILIELDGPHHFKQISNWDPPEKTRNTDKYKMMCANRKGYSVIRLLWKDVHFDKNSWIEKLLKAIDRIITNGGPRNIFICSNNEYEVYMD